MSLATRVLSPIVDVRKDEASAVSLMFLYSFLVMASYNIVKPLTRSEFIDDFGADNLPWVLLVGGILIGVIMQVYANLVTRLPPKSVIPVTQIGLTGLLVVFWVLFQTGQAWASVAFYFLGQIMGLLLISHFWTLANDIYDARQAKRLFGFVGGGASLGGIAGSAATRFLVERLGSETMILASAALLLVCVGVVGSIMQASPVALSGIASAGAKEGVSRNEALRLLRDSKHLQVIALVIGFAAVGAGLLDQQLNMAAQEARGAGGSDAIGAFLAEVGLYISIAGFIIQVWLTSRIHRLLGVGFALLMLPVSLAASGVLVLATGALWAAATGRILDSSLRYSVDKTTREILFLPLPAELKHKAKAFVDVTVDRFSKAILAVLLLILVKGFGLEWRELSIVSVTMVGAWVYTAIRARRGYLASFRETLERQGVEPAAVRLTVADLSTVETLVEELAHPDERRVLYAIEVLDSLDKRNLITPLLLHHESSAVRARALSALKDARPDIGERWVPTIETMIGDTSTDVRAAAIGTLASIRNEDAAVLARDLLHDADPRIVATAAVILSSAEQPADQAAAQKALAALAADTRESASAVRRDLAAAIRHVGDLRTHDLLIPLLHDPNPEVADEAMRSVRALGATNSLFAPTLVSLLGNRRLKGGARETLVSYGPPVVKVLRYFVTDDQEDVWVRRHIPATLAHIPCQESMDILVELLSVDDAFLRFKVLTAIEKLRREYPSLTYKTETLEQRALGEGRSYFNRLSLHHNLFDRAKLPVESLLAAALHEKMTRTVDRIYRLLGLLYPWKDVAAARWAIENGGTRARASALEYLDNILSAQLRRQVMPILDELPREEKVRRGNLLLKTRPRDVEETLLELINDDDQVVAAVAIDLVGELEMWSLADDVEHVLAHRSPRDWYVFESASWTLAARRLSAPRRRERWGEPLPAATLAARMRVLPLFALVGVDEIFRMAGTGHQVRHDAGTTLLREGAVPDSLHLLLDGRVVATGRRTGAREITPPAAIGFEESLHGSLMPETVKTVGHAVSLRLSAEQLRTLLSDNTDLVQGLFGTLAKRQGAKPGFLRTQAPDELERMSGQLSEIQRVLALQQIPLFAHISSVELPFLAPIARQVDLEQDAVLADESGPFGLGILLSGGLGLRAPHSPVPVATAQPGDVIGVYETLAGLATGSPSEKLQLVVTKPGSALQIDRDELFDVLGQRPDMLQQVFAALVDPNPHPGPHRR